MRTKHVFGNKSIQIFSVEHLDSVIEGIKPYVITMSDGSALSKESYEDTKEFWMTIGIAGCVITGLLVVVAFLLCLYCSQKRRKPPPSRSDSCPSCQRPIYCEGFHCSVAESVHSNIELHRQIQGQMDGVCVESQQSVPYHIVNSNPLYRESPGSSTANEIEGNIFGPLASLYNVTERSLTQTVCGKLLVSIARNVGYKGDLLVLDNMGISLKVPEGAIKVGTTKLIVLVLNWDLSDNPMMDEKESLVSPVVYVGPHGLKLDKPCTLTFRHCAFNPNQIKVLKSETELTDQKDWIVTRPANRESNDDVDFVNLTPDECQLQIETFTLYTCVQTPVSNRTGKKWLQVAVFACPLRAQADHHQIRIYFLNKTNCALQWAIQNEAQFGGKLVCPEKVFLFDGNEFDMYTQTRYISDGWELIDKNNSEKISFLNIWHGQCPHISLCFRRVNAAVQRNDSVTIEMILHLFAFQTTLEDHGEKIFVQLFEDDKSPVNDKAMKLMCNHHVDIQINNFVGEDESEIMDGKASLSRKRPVFHINSSADGLTEASDGNQGECHVSPGQRSSISVNSSPVKLQKDMENYLNMYGETSLTGKEAEGRQKSSYSFSYDKLSRRGSRPRSKDIPISKQYSSADKDLNIVINNSYKATTSCHTKDLTGQYTVSNKKRLMSHSLRKRLQLLLDPPKGPYGNDWRDLASKFGLDSCIPKLQTKDSPTEELLSVAEEKGLTLEELKDMFEKIDRKDCVSVINKYLRVQCSTAGREATENSELA